MEKKELSEVPKSPNDEVKRPSTKSKEPLAPKKPNPDDALRKLKRRLLNKLISACGTKMDFSDSALKNWLKFYEYNVSMTEAKIRKCLEFRKKNKIDTITKDYTPPPVLLMHTTGGVCGEDKDGSPVIYELFGVLDLYGLIKSVSKEVIISYKIYQLEKIREHMKVLSVNCGKRIDTALLIFDMSMCKTEALGGVAMRIWSELIQLIQEYYPCILKEIIIINVTTVFLEVYLALRPSLTRSLLRIIKVVGINYMKFLLKRIEKHQIPACLGGYKCDYDGDPMCRSDINWNSKVPQWFYQTDPRLCADTTWITILAGDRKVIEYHVPEVDCVFTWQFFDINHPVVFSIHLNLLGDKNSVVKRTVLDNDSQHVNGLLQCHTPGRYLFVLDNCKNYGQPAKIRYRTEISLPRTLAARLQHKLPRGDSIQFWDTVNDYERKLRQEVQATNPSFTIPAEINSQGMRN